MTDVRVPRLLAALHHAERRGSREQRMFLRLKLLQRFGQNNEMGIPIQTLKMHARFLLVNEPHEKAVRRLWHIGGVGRKLIPLLTAQVVMFSVGILNAACGYRCSFARPTARPAQTKDLYSVATLVSSYLVYISDLRALACVSTDFRVAIRECANHRVRRSTPLCWRDVIFAHEHALRTRLPGGGAISVKKVKEEAATSVICVDERLDVFEFMLRAYAAGKSRGALMFDSQLSSSRRPPKDVRSICTVHATPTPDNWVAMWLAAFGCCLAEQNFIVCAHLVGIAPNEHLSQMAWAAMRVFVRH